METKSFAVNLQTQKRYAISCFRGFDLLRNTSLSHTFFFNKHCHLSVTFYLSSSSLKIKGNVRRLAPSMLLVKKTNSSRPAIYLNLCVYFPPFSPRVLFTLGIGWNN